MLHAISGTVTAFDGSTVVINTGSIDFCLSVPSTLTCLKEQTVKLLVYMHWNQEQGPTLYGFEKELDKTLFLLIISCSGIGPKIALAMLSELGGNAILTAITEADIKALSGVSGIGTKKAEQMIVQLKHKVAKLVSSGAVLHEAQSTVDLHNIQQVLSSLHYSRTEINGAMQWLHEQNKGNIASFDLLVRQALSFLAKKA